MYFATLARPWSMNVIYRLRSVKCDASRLQLLHKTVFCAHYLLILVDFIACTWPGHGTKLRRVYSQERQHEGGENVGAERRIGNCAD